MAVTRTGQNAIQLAVVAGIRDTHPEVIISDIKFHPGLWREDAAILKFGQTAFADVSSFVNEPSYCVGLMVQVTWRNIETSLDVYDFTALNAAYTALSNAGKYMMVNLWPFRITTNTAFPTDSLPLYLQNAPYHGHSFISYGCCANLHFVEDMGRFTKLIQKIGEWGNDKPFFEGIQVFETAMSPSGGGLLLIDQIEAAVPLWRAALPNCLICARWNYTQGSTATQITRLTELAELAQTYAIGIGSTDSTPTRTTSMERILAGSGVISGVNYGTKDYRSLIPITPCSEFAPYASGANATTILGWIKNTTLANYFFPKYYAGNNFAFTWTDIKNAYVATYGSTLNMSLPASY